MSEQWYHDTLEHPTAMDGCEQCKTRLPVVQHPAPGEVCACPLCVPEKYAAPAPQPDAASEEIRCPLDDHYRRCIRAAGHDGPCAYASGPGWRETEARLRERLVEVEREIATYTEQAGEWLETAPELRVPACIGVALRHAADIDRDLADTRRKLAGLVAAVDRYVQAGDAADEASMGFAPDDSAEEAVSEAWITLLEALAEVRGAADAAREGGDDGE